MPTWNNACIKWRLLSLPSGHCWWPQEVVGNDLWLEHVLLWPPLTAAWSCMQRCAMAFQLTFLSLATCPQDGQGRRRNGMAPGPATTLGRRAVSLSLPRAQDLFQAAHGQGADCLPTHLCCPHTGFKHCLQPWAWFSRRWSAAQVWKERLWAPILPLWCLPSCSQEKHLPGLFLPAFVAAWFRSSG